MAAASSFFFSVCCYSSLLGVGNDVARTSHKPVGRSDQYGRVYHRDLIPNPRYRRGYANVQYRHSAKGKAVSVEDTKDFTNETPRAKAHELLQQVIDNLKKQQRGKTQRMNLLIEVNTHLNNIQQTEWDILLDELKDLQQDIDLLRVISKHLT